jgi:hypothetical protein
VVGTGLEDMEANSGDSVETRSIKPENRPMFSCCSFGGAKRKRGSVRERVEGGLMVMIALGLADGDEEVVRRVKEVGGVRLCVLLGYCCFVFLCLIHFQSMSDPSLGSEGNLADHREKNPSDRFLGAPPESRHLKTPNN